MTLPSLSAAQGSMWVGECRSRWLLMQVGCVHTAAQQSKWFQVPAIAWTPAQHTPRTGHTCMHTHPQQCTGHGPQQGLRGMAPVMAHLQGQRGLSWAGGQNGRGGVSLRLGQQCVWQQHNRGAGAPLAQGTKGSAGWQGRAASRVLCSLLCQGLEHGPACRLPAGQARAMQKGCAVVTCCAILPQPQLFQLIPRQPKEGIMKCRRLGAQSQNCLHGLHFVGCGQTAAPTDANHT